MLVFLLGLGRHCVLYSTQKCFLGVVLINTYYCKICKNGCDGGLYTLDFKKKSSPSCVCK
jgi:hypothetical protein